jgi:PAS domain S-box-containing protein
MQQSKNKKTLLIEDNPGDVRLIEIMLSESPAIKFEMVSADSISSAIELLQKISPDVILLDLNLPDSQGLDSVFKIKSHVGDKPIVILTGIDDDLLGIKSIEAGAHDYLCKNNIDSNQLIRSINYAITRKHLEDVLQNEKTKLESMVEKRTEELLQSISKLQSISDTAFDAIVLVDQNNRIVFWNKGAVRILGYSYEEAIGKDFNFFLSSKDTTSNHHEPVNRSLITHDKFFSGIIMEFVAITREKTKLYLEASLSSLYLNNEMHIVSILRDITERKIYQESLEKINRDLKIATKHRDRFLSTISHELRTPLNSIIGFSDMLDKQYFGPLNEKQQEYVTHIKNSGNHLLALINDVLDIARIDQGKITLNIENIHIEEAIEEAVSLVLSTIEEKNIKTETTINPDIKYIQADKTRFRQILLNLFSNACKYSPENETVNIHVSKTETNKTFLSVTDRGIGINKEEYEKIFEEFYQTQYTKEKAIGGTGIGLALTKRLVELHNGEIGVSCSKENGTTFWIIIPVYTV